MTKRVQSVVVVGRDAPAWLVACALQRSLGATGLRVQVIELPSQQSSVDVYSAVPALGALHRLLGLEESAVLRTCQGMPMVAQRFSNWSKSAPPYFISYDDEPPPGSDLPFVDYWVKGALEGLQVPFGDFSFGTACARLGRVPTEHGESLGSLSANYGYHLDARSYTELLRQSALRSGVELAGHAIASVKIDGDRIASVQTGDGRSIAADLFIDASGSERILIDGLPGAEFESWRQWFPCDRLIACSGPRLNSLPAFSQLSAFRAGWAGLFPLQDRTAVAAAYSSSTISDQEVTQQLSVLARLPIAGDAVVSELNQGVQRRAWIGNCISVADAAVALEPLDGLTLHVAHGCISHLLTLFPATSDQFPEAAVYNRSILSFAANVRDFQLGHYKLNRRFDDALWDRARDAVVPASLQRKIDMFAARSIVTLYDDETFQEQSWTALFTGSGLLPTGYDPRIDLVRGEDLIAKVQQRLRGVPELAARMPTVDQFLGLPQVSPAQVVQ